MESRYFNNQSMDESPIEQGVLIDHLQTYLQELSLIFQDLLAAQQQKLNRLVSKQEEDDDTPIELSSAQRELFDFAEVIEQLLTELNQEKIKHYLHAFIIMQNNEHVDLDTKISLANAYHFMHHNLLQFPAKSDEEILQKMKSISLNEKPKASNMTQGMAQLMSRFHIHAQNQVLPSSEDTIMEENDFPSSPKP